MPISTPRLYRKESGVYFVRVLASVQVSGTQIKREIRRSLHTTSPRKARELSAALNAALACVPMSVRIHTLDSWHSLYVRQSATREALTTHGHVTPSTVWAQGLPRVQALPSEQEFSPGLQPNLGALHRTVEPNSPSEPDKREQAHGKELQLPSPSAADSFEAPIGVANPLPWNDATHRYAASLRADAAVKEKTLQERLKTLTQLSNFMVRQPGIGPTFHVHDVLKHHVGSFIDEWAQRPARSERTKVRNQANTSFATVAPKSLLKCISNLILFFAWARQEAGSSAIDPTDGLRRRTLALRSRINHGESGYIPFNDEQLKTIFEPASYLRECRDADHFWAPLLGVHLGVRLGEIVTLELDAVRQHEISGIWYLDIRPEAAKNRNSVRRLPITRPLIELGFLDYVEKLQRLGATSLFPHRNLKNPSALRQPSKNVSEKFARYLDLCHVRDPRLVFHSFRHTVVTALQYAGTPLHVSQQIVGHMAQDHAIRTGQITQAQARSVTLRTYTHADIPSMRVADPFLALKSALELAMNLPLDYSRLAKAAAVVLDHVKRTPTDFESGWPAQNQAYTRQMVQLLDFT